MYVEKVTAWHVSSEIPTVEQALYLTCLQREDFDVVIFVPNGIGRRCEHNGIAAGQDLGPAVGSLARTELSNRLWCVSRVSHPQQGPNKIEGSYNVVVLAPSG